MYSVVLMMAMTSPADDLAFGRRGGCDGGAAYSCVGAPVSHACHGGGFLGLRGRRHGCDGGYACHGGASCDGGAGCHGGFLGLRGKLFGRRGGCHGVVVSDCCAPANCCAPTTCCAPACCQPAVVTTHGCCGGTAAAPAAPAAPAQPAAPPAKMPEPEPKKE